MHFQIKKKKSEQVPRPMHEKRKYENPPETETERKSSNLYQRLFHGSTGRYMMMEKCHQNSGRT